MPASVNTDICCGCKHCAWQCPVGAITIKDGKAEIDEGRCIECGACLGVCQEESEGALSL